MPKYAFCYAFRDFDFNLGFDERRGRGDRGNPNLDPEMDIQQNREFYMHNDVRPPYTYAALIRYVSRAYYLHYKQRYPIK